MKNLLFFAMIISSFGCQTTSPSVQEQLTGGDIDGNDDASESPIVKQTSNPGQLTFTLEILETYTTAKEICGVTKENVVRIRVVEIIEKGMGISDIPKPKDEILINFIILPDELEANSRLEVKAKEFLCLDVSKNYFTVISHKILE